MNIFISHSSKDEKTYVELADALKKQGHTVFNAVTIDVGELWVDKIKSALNESDIFIVLVTDNFLNSSWAQAELSSAVFGMNNIRLLPVVVGDVFLPSFLSLYQYRKVDSLEEVTSTVIADVLRLSHSENSASFLKKQVTQQIETDDANEKINLLRNALVDNQLTLVCGAGISKESYMPDWNELLVNILNEVFFDDDSDSTASKISAKDLLLALPQSNLILGKYLRMVLKNDFEKVVQKHLYYYYNENRDHETSISFQGKVSINYALETNIIKAIVELARPRRTGTSLESIITFNFDDLIEQALSLHNIEYCSIWQEGQVRGLDALPIYHVHGFLSNNSKIENPNLVFSEEAYHSQFIDPYSWANLIQLNTFSANVCLFIGLSLSDPNLRRLLDISWRRNQRCKHYIISRKPAKNGKVEEITTMLFEQDANSLGLNVIWCSDFKEIPDILIKVIKRH